jgi:L-rhamnose mutarotase
MVTYDEFLKALKIIEEYKEQISYIHEQVIAIKDRPNIKYNEYSTFLKTNVSKRFIEILKDNDIEHISLKKFSEEWSESKILRYKYTGKRMIAEVRVILENVDLYLKFK